MSDGWILVVVLAAICVFCAFFFYAIYDVLEPIEEHEPEICYRFEPMTTITTYELALCMKAHTTPGSKYCVDEIGAIINEKVFETLDIKLKKHWIKDKTKSFIRCGS